MIKLARLLESPIPFSWDSCVFYHLRSANLMHLKPAGTCTPACWHPPPTGACEMSGGRQDSWEHPWWMAECWEWHLALGPSHWRLTLQLDLFCHSSISLLVMKPRLVSPANECLAFDFTGDQKFNPFPDCSALSPSIQRILTFPNSPASKSCPGSWQWKSNDLINMKHRVAMEGAFLVRKISSFLSVNEC